QFGAKILALDSPCPSVTRTRFAPAPWRAGPSGVSSFMPGLTRLFGLSASARAIASLLFAAPAQAQGVVRAPHDDWQIRCDTPPGAKSEQCALVQTVTAQDRPNVGLSIIVLKLADNKNRLLRILAPLGVLLPAGLGLRIDDAEIGRAGFVRC